MNKKYITINVTAIIKIIIYYTLSIIPPSEYVWYYCNVQKIQPYEKDEIPVIKKISQYLNSKS